MVRAQKTIWIINNVLSITLSFCVIIKSFSPLKQNKQTKKQQVFISLKPQKPKQAVSLLFSSESCHCFVWMSWVCECVTGYVWAGGCAYMCTFLRSVISFCKCYASTKKKWSISTSFVSWKSNSIFSDQSTEQGLILYPVVQRGFNFFFFLVMLIGGEFSIWTGRIGSKEVTTEKAHVGKQNKGVAMATLHLRLTLWTRALQVFEQTPSRLLQYNGSLNTAGHFSLLGSCYRDCLAVDYSVYLSSFLECVLDLWPYLWKI